MTALLCLSVRLAGHCDGGCPAQILSLVTHSLVYFTGRPSLGPLESTHHLTTVPTRKGLLSLRFTRMGCSAVHKIYDVLESQILVQLHGTTLVR
jgi:hypothetical protein